MATCDVVIRSAYRRCGAIAAGVTLDEIAMAVGLERLNDAYLKMLGDGLFGKLTDYYLATGNYTALENQRIFQADNTSTITIPKTLQDPDTGLIRPPLDGTIIVVINGSAAPPYVPSISLYDVLYGWQSIKALSLTDYAPLSGRYEDGLKNFLGVLIADDAGLPVPPVLARGATTFRVNFTSKYDQPRKDAVGVYM